MVAGSDLGAARAARPHPVVELTLMRLREITREPGVLFWAFGFPLLIALALGFAFRVKRAEPPVVGLLPGVPAEVSGALAAGGVRAKPLDEAAARAELRAGRVDLVLAPAAGAGAGGVAYRFDPLRPEARLSRDTVDDVLQRAAGRRDARAVRDEEVRERGARYIDFLIPGLMGMNLMMGSMWGIGWAIVNMRVRRLLKRLMAAPMQRRHLFYAQGIARLVVITVELGVLLLFARLVFDVRVAGSWLALALLAVAGSASFAGIAVLAASRAQNNETMSGLMNLVMMPMFILSGVFFSSSHFPDAVQPLIALLPLTAICDGLRAVMIDGAGLAAVAKPLAVMGAWGAGCFALGLRLFRWS
jgi:ABC-type polysaccharide/polyol phosphate export permease